VLPLRAGGTPALPGEDLEIEVFESVALRDGSGANNPWLQELPDPITKITWDNVAAIAPALARERGIAEGQWIEIRVAHPTAGDRVLRLPAHIQPGQHPRTIAIALGYGRTHAGPAGSGVGVNAYPLLTARGGRSLAAMQVLGQRTALARTQIHDSLEGRPIVQESTFAAVRAGSRFKVQGSKLPASSTLNLEPPNLEPDRREHANLWPEPERGEYRWGMVVDLTRCIGCSACVTSCDIENNVPVVGRDEVGRQREMHWLRIDRYFAGDPEAPEVVHQPMPCQQCENASCEAVCPALATVHDDQGLNVQVYNRCVGTRYCANSCPYKVRRFNFFENSRNDLTRNLALNPDVTVRSRGIM
jgi:molybdopterin-containing oxidoreductase family iron-sulfur binding subunit